MPNHCENDLYIRGDDADVAEVLAFVGADQCPPRFDFNAILPYPEPYASMDREYKELDSWPAPNDPEREAKIEERTRQLATYVAKWGTEKDGYNSGGYDWCCENWGTKWDAGDVARRDYDGRVTVTFQTAWTPPIPVIQALAERFIRCTFVLEYFERGMQFCGGMRWPNDEDYYDDDLEPWHPGIKVDEWKGKYRGCRGG